MKPNFTNVTDLWNKLEEKTENEKEQTSLENFRRKVCEHLSVITGSGSKVYVRKVFDTTEYPLDELRQEFPTYYLSVLHIVNCQMELLDVLVKHPYDNLKDNDKTIWTYLKEADIAEDCSSYVFSIRKLGIWTASHSNYQITPAIIRECAGHIWYFSPLEQLIKRWQNIGMSP